MSTYSLTFSFFAVRAFGNSQFDKASLSLFSLGNMENSKGSAAAKEKLNSKKGCIGIQDESITVFPFFLLLPQYGHQFVTEKMDWLCYWPLFILIWYSIDILTLLWIWNILSSQDCFPRTFQSSKCLEYSSMYCQIHTSIRVVIFKVDLNMSMRLTSLCFLVSVALVVFNHP